MHDIAEKHVGALNAAANKLMAAINTAVSEYNAEITQLEVERSLKMDHRMKLFQEGVPEDAKAAPPAPPKPFPKALYVPPATKALDDDEFRESLPRAILPRAI